MSHTVRVVGLGPYGLDHVPEATQTILQDPATTVVVRTIRHPAAAELAAQRDVIDCDDLYEDADTHAEVYHGIVARLSALADDGPVAFAVPGSPAVGERVLRLLDEAGLRVEVIAGLSFIDAALASLRLDPLDRGFQVLDAQSLPEPLLLHVPTLVAHLTSAARVDAIRDGLLTLLPADTEVTLLRDLGGPEETLESLPVSDLRPAHAGLRVSLFIDVDPPGWPGLVRTNARLRSECPWDREQTHHSLARHLLEEAHEVLEAIEALPSDAPGGEPDIAGYVDLEEELGDLLVQVVFHAALASEAGVFGVEEVAEGIRRKLVARHPHVFGDVDAPTADHVMANWDRLKRDEKGRASLLDGVPKSLPSLARARDVQARAAAAGFDWPSVDGPLEKVAEEAGELAAAGDDAERRAAELGDLLFSLVNVSRHLGVDPEQALRAATRRFETRFRAMEEEGDLRGLTLDELDDRWERAKGPPH